MSIYRYITIFPCPFDDVCGPEASWSGYSFEADEDEKFCLTWLHVACPQYRFRMFGETPGGNPSQDTRVGH